MNELVCFDLISIDRVGIIAKNKAKTVLINFNECTKNYAKQKGLTTNKCVATRDITTLTFTFYTEPKIKITFKKNFLKDLFTRNSATRKFFELNKTINRYGYTSYDMS